MKKIISFISVLLLLLTGTSFAIAEPKVLFAEITGGLPTTYAPTEISLFSTTEADKKAELEKRLLAAWENLQPTADISDLDIPLSYWSSLAQFYFDFLYHNPIYYYVARTVNASYYEDTNTLAEIIIYYNTDDKSQIKNTMAELQAATDNILMTIDDDMTEFEKVITVHDYMVLNYHYDNSLVNHSITIMLTKTGVCESYTFAFQHLMNELGIDCTYVSSKTMNHAWNLVKVDGNWYHIDLTWDDAQNKHLEDNFAVVNHDNALLSTAKIQSMENPHFGFNLNGLVADSTLYDDATWHTDAGAIAHLDGMEYWVADNTLVREDGKVIRYNLDGGDNMWSLPDGRVFEEKVATGLVAYNGLLYFNTETEIYTYNPKTEEITLFYQIPDNKITYGIYLDGNTLRYSKYCPNNCGCNHFCEGGSIKLGDVTIKSSINKDGDILIKALKETEDTILIFDFNGKEYDMHKLEGKGYITTVFNAEKEQTLFFWDENLKPLKPKEVIKR